MRTMAQFSIKGGDLGLSVPAPATPTVGSAAEHAAPKATRMRRAPGTKGPAGRAAARAGFAPQRRCSRRRRRRRRGASSSLRNVEHAPQILEQRELEQQMEGMAALGAGGDAYGFGDHRQSLATPLAEMPADELPRHRGEHGDDDDERDNDEEEEHAYADEDRDGETPTADEEDVSYDLPDFGNFSLDDDDVPPPQVGPKPGGSLGSPSSAAGQMPQIRLPAVDGRDSFEDWSPAGGSARDAAATTPAAAAAVPGPGRGTGRSMSDDWARDAGMYMNLAGSLGRRIGWGTGHCFHVKKLLPSALYFAWVTLSWISVCGSRRGVGLNAWGWSDDISRTMKCCHILLHTE